MYSEFRLGIISFGNLLPAYKDRESSFFFFLLSLQTLCNVVFTQEAREAVKQILATLLGSDVEQFSLVFDNYKIFHNKIQGIYRRRRRKQRYYSSRQTWKNA